MSLTPFLYTPKQFFLVQGGIKIYFYTPPEQILFSVRGGL